jgi:cytochrome c oxidase subunit I
VSTQILAGVLFVFGGIGGMTNASYNINLVIHNTTWVPGHFHLTVASATTLSFMGIAYWLVPKLTNKQLFSTRVALWQAWTWFAGMLLMSNGLHILGLNFSMPRRTMIGAAQYVGADWNPMLIESAIGGIILGISGILFYTNVIGTVFSKKTLQAPIEMPVAEALDTEPSPAWLDTWKPWLAVTVALIVIAYGPVLFDLIRNINLTSPGFKVW